MTRWGVVCLLLVSVSSQASAGDWWGGSLDVSASGAFDRQGSNLKGDLRGSVWFGEGATPGGDDSNGLLGHEIDHPYDWGFGVDLETVGLMAQDLQGAGRISGQLLGTSTIGLGLLGIGFVTRYQKPTRFSDAIWGDHRDVWSLGGVFDVSLGFDWGSDTALRVFSVSVGFDFCLDRDNSACDAQGMLVEAVPLEIMDLEGDTFLTAGLGRSNIEFRRGGDHTHFITDILYFEGWRLFDASWMTSLGIGVRGSYLEDLPLESLPQDVEPDSDGLGLLTPHVWLEQSYLFEPSTRRRPTSPDDPSPLGPHTGLGIRLATYQRIYAPTQALDFGAEALLAAAWSPRDGFLLDIQVLGILAERQYTSDPGAALQAGDLVAIGRAQGTLDWVLYDSLNAFASTWVEYSDRDDLLRTQERSFELDSRGMRLHYGIEAGLRWTLGDIGE